MKIALAQLNPTVGDLAGNCELVVSAARKARQAGADVLVASELVVSGYPPKDLLLREGFVAACDRAVDELAARVPAGLTVIVGHPTHRDVPGGRVANSASVLEEGRVAANVHKMLLPNYDVFDEQRYFRPADRIAPVVIRGRRVGLHICEDAWWGDESTSLPRSAGGASRSGRSVGRGWCRLFYQRFGESVRAQQAGPPAGDRDAARAAVEKAVRVRQPGRRQRRSGFRRAQLRAGRGGTRQFGAVRI